MNAAGKVLLTLLVFLERSCSFALAIRDPPLFLPADSPQLQYTGRVAKNGSTVLWEWTGIKTAARIQCARDQPMYVQVHIEVPTCRVNALYTTHELEKYDVLVNGVHRASFQTQIGQSIYNITLPNSPSEDQVIEVLKITERMTIPIFWGQSEGFPATVFRGIGVPSSCTPLAPPSRPERRIEFIGDSITCGFGNGASGMLDLAKCAVPPLYGHGGWLDYQNFSNAWPTLVSDSFNAEAHTQCISQEGITRYGTEILGRTSPFNMSYYLHRTLPTLPESKYTWDYKTWIPDIAVINLGTNDYDISQFLHEQPSFADFEGNYTKLLQEYVSRYDGKLSALLLLCGPMTKMQCPSVAKVATALKTANPALRIRYEELTLKKTDGLGCMLHPNAAGDKTIYETIAPVIADMTGWSALASRSSMTIQNPLVV